jgi:hypothetical protein
LPEQPAVPADTELVDMPAQDLDQLGRDGHRADLILGPVLEALFIVRLAAIGVTPAGLRRGPGQVQQRRARGHDRQQRRPVPVGLEAHRRPHIRRQGQRGHAAGGLQAASFAG